MFYFYNPRIFKNKNASLVAQASVRHLGWQYRECPAMLTASKAKLPRFGGVSSTRTRSMYRACSSTSKHPVERCRWFCRCKDCAGKSCSKASSSTRRASLDASEKRRKELRKGGAVYSDNHFRPLVSLVYMVFKQIQVDCLDLPCSISSTRMPP